MFIGRTDVEAATPILWLPDAKSWLIWKDPDAVKDWRQEEKGMMEDGMVGWHHGLNGHGFRWTPWVGDGQGGLMCCSSWGHKESDVTERLSWTDMYYIFIYSLTDGHLVAYMSWLLLTVLQWTLECMYLFKLEFSLDGCSRVKFLDHWVALFLVFSPCSS